MGRWTQKQECAAPDPFGNSIRASASSPSAPPTPTPDQARGALQSLRSPESCGMHSLYLSSLPSDLSPPGLAGELSHSSCPWPLHPDPTQEKLSLPMGPPDTCSPLTCVGLPSFWRLYMNRPTWPPNTKNTSSRVTLVSSSQASQPSTSPTQLPAAL